MTDFTIHQLTPEEWPRYRDVRLRALADSPESFASTLVDSQKFAAERWIDRLTNPAAAVFVARRKGEDVGLIASAPYGDWAGLYSMWVAPAARGKGVGDALVAAVIHWTTAQGQTRLVLDVGETNQSAIKLYTRMGFTPTGITGTQPPPRDHIREFQMAVKLPR